MAARLAETDPFERVTEMVGSGPFRFVAGEQVVGVGMAVARYLLTCRSERPKAESGERMAL